MGNDVRFPRLAVETLSGTPLLLPDAAEGDPALVALVFRRRAQPIVDSWIHPISRRYADDAHFAWYEIPMIAGGWRTVSGFIDAGMRSGIHPAHHDHVATFYGDSTRIRSRLGIDDLDSASVFLLDSHGSVAWRASGWARPRRLDELNALVRELRSDSLDG